MKHYWFAVFVVGLAGSVVVAKPATPDYSNIDGIAEPVKKSSSSPAQTYREILNTSPCNVANVVDAGATINMPKTHGEIEGNGNYYRVDESAAIFHNFREGVLSGKSSSDEVSRAMGRAVAEYWLEKAGIMSKSNWQVLDPDMPNVKYVSIDGLSEAVYNRHTGLKVGTGINAGTANVANGPLDLDHWYRDQGGDIGRFARCKTPNELQRQLAQFLLAHPEFIPSALAKETFLRETERTMGDGGGMSQFENTAQQANLSDKSKRSDVSHRDRSLSHDDVIDALREDGTGSALAVTALGDDGSKAGEAKIKKSFSNAQQTHGGSSLR